LSVVAKEDLREMKKLYKVVRLPGDGGPRRLRIDDGDGESLRIIDESQYESVDGKAAKILDRLWAMTDGEIIETLLEEGLIF
jgi:hypothetical protein